MKVQARAAIIAGLTLFLAAACGDPNMRENRGYTKAPLERAGVPGGGERPGEVAQFGGPRRVAAERIELPEAPPPVAAVTPTAPVDLPAGVTQEMVALGEELFNGRGNCFTCHGRAGAGGPLAPALNEDDWIHIDGSFDALAQIIAAGVAQPVQYPAPMPARGGAQIDEDQVRQIAAYVYAISR
jgi:mono/diheme cytochrome c family protein